MSRSWAAAAFTDGVAFCVGYFHLDLSEVGEESLCCSSFKEGVTVGREGPTF